MIASKLPFSIIFSVVVTTVLAMSANASTSKRPISLGEQGKLISIQKQKECTLSPNINRENDKEPDEIRAMLQKIVDGKRATGIAVGWATPNGRCVVGVGASGKTARAQIDGETMFELGSISKGFTGTLLADMVAKGELKIDDAIGPYLPKAAQGNAALTAVTFRQLATHTSGLGRVPLSTAFVIAGLKSPADPYANYSEEDFVKDLANMSVTKNADFAYSNTGIALLGMVLANRAVKRYDELVRERLLAPIGMNAEFAPPKNDDPLAAQGHNTKLEPTPAWNLNAFNAAGGMRSSVNEMMKLIDANLVRRSPWKESHEQLAPRGKVGGIAYNWLITRLPSNADGKEKRDTLVWHNGATFGSTSFVGFDVERQIGVVVLINTGARGLADEIGMHLWDRRNPQPAFTAKVKSFGYFAAVIAAIALVGTAWLATRGYASGALANTANATADASDNTDSVQAESISTVARRALFKPFVDRVDVILTSIYSACVWFFALHLIPPFPNPATLNIHHAFAALLVVCVAIALWRTRHLPWWRGGGIRRTIGIVFASAISAIFVMLGSLL
jgi:CubicO group peptidase (beta-lactamase class C family)